jgi:nanoRNase/pAp phosphatase (c-di-AMP/oligoRNAs hydrolase)
MDFVMMISVDPLVVSYRSVKENVSVRQVAEHFGGKGHEKASSNPIDEDTKKMLVRILTKE